MQAVVVVELMERMLMDLVAQVAVVQVLLLAAL
jgi:hypothetical protein